MGWMARDARFTGQQLGQLLLAEAIKRLAAAPMGLNAICADAIDDAAAEFYRQHQFQAFVSRERGFYLPMQTALKLLA
jgi:GNAT superfamily N-acetyltransferase